MEVWNILATSHRSQEHHVLRILNRLGEFRHSGYRDVIIGHVIDVASFLDELEKIRRETPEKLRSLSQIVPIERNFQFEVANFVEKSKEAVFPYIDRLANTRFFVRVARRGHKGEISSLEVEHILDAYILESLEKEGKQATINIEEFDNMIAIETIENRAGVGLIKKEMKEKYPFIKIK
jgi:tRNA(Ser,Leu) C12 N-acetylase TAN1